ncbi:hypothetical protein [Pseudomonas viridiflava]|uniref:hypothetical protein n=1 Tax=Pseudomonas viridiflava TaxID=33069 RepID=UPI000F010F9F|nr:hypothetical protein [Pseudomonas viridiflava]
MDKGNSHKAKGKPLAFCAFAVPTSKVSAQYREQPEEHGLVGGGLPAMNDNAVRLRNRAGCIAGKPPLIK